MRAGPVVAGVGRGVSAADAPPALRLRDLHKSFGDRIALDGASFEVAQGEVHALLGENGAGKSTLMNVVAGLYAPDSGSVEIGGTPVFLGGPRDALAVGVGMIHQHFKLVAPLTAAENLRLACGRIHGWRSTADAAAALVRTATDLGFDLPPDAPVGDLPVAVQQRLEIVKALVGGARLLIMDEPTAVLTDTEAESVLSLAGRLAADGRAVVLITHKMRDVEGHADRVTVMRAGRTVLSGVPTHAATPAMLVSAMMGAGGAPPLARPARAAGPVRLELAAVCAAGGGHRMPLTDISFALRGGQILGIAGVGGNGQTELVETLIGLAEPTSGDLRVDGRDVPPGPQGRRAAGIRFIPDDRYRLGLIGDLSIADNLALAQVVAGERPSRRLRQRAAEAITAFDIAGGSLAAPARLLSGGNAQKLLIAREFSSDFAILVAHAPTRGLDVRAVAAVRDRLLQAAARGAAILLLSEDLDEVLDMADHIAVLSRGRLTDPVPAAAVDRAAIGRLILGAASR